MHIKSLKDSANMLYQEICKDGHPEWLVAVAEGDNKIIVYVSNEMNALHKLQMCSVPEKFCGWTIEVVKTDKAMML